MSSPAWCHPGRSAPSSYATAAFPLCWTQHLHWHATAHTVRIFRSFCLHYGRPCVCNATESHSVWMRFCPISNAVLGGHWSPQQNLTRRCHMFGNKPGWKTVVQNLGYFPLKSGAKYCLFSCGFRTTSRLKRECIRSETNLWQIFKNIVTTKGSLHIAKTRRILAQKRLRCHGLISFSSLPVCLQNGSQPNFSTYSQVSQTVEYALNNLGAPSHKTLTQKLAFSNTFTTTYERK